MSLLLLGAPALAVTGGDALLREATAIVEELGPRPVGSRAADDAQAWAFDTLDAAGWRPVRVEGIDGFTVGCRPGASDRIVLFLAHTDSVHEDVPGAVDNAGAMAVLAAVARDLPATEVTPRTVCLAFPDAEEVGLLGSRQLAEQREHYLPGPVDQVMALDLVGRGTLTHNGLGPAWSGSRLRALLHAAPADVPYVYRAISEGRPELERSDHHWFGRAGIPSSHLLSRGESGVLWTYHTSRDTPDTLQPEALAAAYGAVWGVAHAPVLPAGEPIVPPLVVPFTHLVVPGGIVALGLSALLGVAVAG
ncbi:MAG: M20/M25/M40 family metallo-hydrolase, partial [Myxococcota bacterium]